VVMDVSIARPGPRGSGNGSALVAGGGAGMAGRDRAEPGHVVGRQGWSRRRERVPTAAPAVPYAPVMANKAPPSGQNKKQGKSLMEKRAEKKAKKNEKSRSNSTS